eukprot:TRINITY_DN3037_c0_g1_i5.p1 TRINITY_DN3037_c0_g1~~TRINITY_DN3037_c0_g1_i5.p1  ORF type:complete len:343 (-),score=63.36 TRINITY_DN3037_c0_g1_i5:265-1293(-)
MNEICMLNFSGVSAMPEYLMRFSEHFASIPWITYRKDFAPLSSGGLTSDAGWGCMLRTGQMLVAEAYKRLVLGDGWRLNETSDKSLYCEMLRWFSDSPEEASYFSIHRIVSVSQRFGLEAGYWYSPSAIGNSLQELVNANTILDNKANGMCMLVCRDGSIYKDQVKSLSISGKTWKPILLYLPLRLGVDSLNPLYIQHIFKTFRWGQSLGIIGGRPRASHYFVGYSGESHLIYLDPHVVQQYSSSADIPLSTYTCKTILRLPVSDLDPSLAMGFLCRSEAEFEDLCTKISTTPFVCVSAKTPGYASTPLMHQGTSHGNSSAFMDPDESEEDAEDDADDFALV